MEKRSRTNKEIYEHLYPFKRVKQSPMLCAEAIGYLRALIQYLPSEENWALPEMIVLMLIVLEQESDLGTIMWEEFSTGLADNLTEVMKIIDDALCYGFEFKVENYKLYFREVA